jgi:hypothetical protein
MFENMLGKKEPKSDEDNKILEKISKMNLVEMRTYVNNNISDFKISEDGLSEVMRRLNSNHEGTSKRFIEIDAMDSKIKKAFELVILISKSKKITVVTTELIQIFIDIYSDLITKYDNDNKQIYSSKLKNSLQISMVTLNEMTNFKRKMNILGS